ncbi:hypothetical protein CRENBAI_024386 [Crenichthys baileyi]|uniref:Uncharacterized protein n=1 Tax=Crenichthys baileyi TaxID=28760 RepID=A0AAV9RPM3_9TELE
MVKAGNSWQPSRLARVPEGFMDEPPPHPDPVPGSVPEGFMDEPPPHPDPVSGPVPEGLLDEPPPHPDPVPSSVPEGSQAELPSHSVPVREGLVDGLPPLPAPVPGPVLEGSEDELPPSLVPVPEEFVEDLSTLPVPVPEGCEDAPSPPAVSRRLRHRSPRPRRRSHRGLSWSRHLPSDHQLLRHRPAQHLRRRLADRLPLRGLLIAGSTGDSLRGSRLNSGSAGDGLWAGCLNSCPPSEATSAHPCRMFVFVFVLWASGIRP